MNVHPMTSDWVADSIREDRLKEVAHHQLLVEIRSNAGLQQSTRSVQRPSVIARLAAAANALVALL